MNKDLYDAVQQVVNELVLPELAKMKADIQQIKEQQTTRPPLARTDGSSPILPPPRPPESRAYLDAICKELDEDLNRRAAAWARRKAKDPNAPASVFGQRKAKK